MEPKPRGWSEVYGAVFGDGDVVRAYHLRPRTQARRSPSSSDCHFSMSGFARSRLAEADAFAHEVRGAVASSLPDSGGRYELDVVGTIIWGRPA